MACALRQPVGIIGAGSSGLAAARAFRRFGFPVEILEREDDLGGNWNIDGSRARIYESTHTVSSKPFTQFPDFPMPDRFPDYPHHTQILEYLRRYSRHFGLDRHIRFSSQVESMERADDGGWNVVVRDRQTGWLNTSHYRAVVVANGHNWSPKVPDIPGRLDGEVIHSADYDEPSIFEDKTVCVVGAGNTGCDLIVQAAQRADRAIHSTRRGYWYAPKFVFGKPGDQIYDMLLALNLPTRLVQALMETTVRLTIGDPTKAGLPRPDHRFLETHPVANDLIIHYAGHGRIQPRPDIARLDGPEVVFADGSREAVDLVVLCTGYLIDIPFLETDHFDMSRDRPRAYLNVFPPDASDLFYVGFIQPDSGQFKLVHWQSMAAARYLKAKTIAPSVARQFDNRRDRRLENRHDGGVDYAESSRHFLEVQHMDYIRELRDAVQLLEVP